MSKALQKLPAILQVVQPRNGTFLVQQAVRNIHVSQAVYRSTPLNTVILFVPQQEAWVVERMGKFDRVLEPGLNFLIPFLDTVKYVQSLKEIAIDIPQQAAITSDNVTLTLDGVLYLRVFNPYKASYGVEDAEFAITQLAQTTMRSELGKIALDSVFRERESLNVSIVESINKASEAWGITCLRYEIRDIQIPKRIQEAMHSQVESERKKRAAILESEGIRTSDINIAEGQKQSRILASEAEKLEKINRAEGEAKGTIVNAEARARSLVLLAEALSRKDGQNAASLNVAELYVDAFKHLAKSTNTVLLPSNSADVSSMVAQAMTVYKTLAQNNAQQAAENAQQAAETNIRDDPTPQYDRGEYYSDDEPGRK